MTPERWAQLDRLFHDAIKREPQQRRTFLESACGDDKSLFQHLQSLIAAHEKSPEFFDNAASELAAELLGGDLAVVSGQTIGPYRVIDLLGVGGMGEVYLAEDSRLKRKVALKLLPAQRGLDIERVHRFAQEARAASALNHPNIVTIHDVGQWKGRDFIATEFVAGNTVRELLRDGALERDTALDVAVQLASALSAAHEAGIVHRDIKPENIMMRPDRILKVLDFGLAKLVAPELATRSNDSTGSFNTNPGMVMGTVQYMSPEQARGGEVDARTDIWSLGVVLYEMLSGRPPFQGETPSHVTVAILEDDPPPIARHAELPIELNQLVGKTLSKDRTNRYQAMHELLVDLREIKDDLLFQSRRRSDNVSSVIEDTQPIKRVASSDPNLLASATRTIPLVTQQHRRRALLSRRTISIGLIIVLMITIGSISLARWLNNRPRSAFSNIEFTRLTVPNQVYAGTISPDGRYIAYVSLTADGQSLWLKQVASDRSVQIVPNAPVDYWAVQFSPNNDFVYYVTEKNDDIRRSILYRVPISGGEPREVLARLSSFAISPDGQKLAFKRSVRATDQVQVLTANIDGTNERVIAEGLGFFFWSFAWSSDNKSIAYVNSIPRGESGDWYVAEIPAEGGPEKIIMQPSPRRLRGLMSIRSTDDFLLLADEETTGTTQVFFLSRQDGELRRITHDLNQYQYAVVTADGRQILTTIRSRPSGLWVGPVDNPREARQIVPDLTDFDHIAWTPDGKLITDEGPYLWEMNADGGERRRLQTDGWAAYPTLTPDGRYIVFASASRDRRLNIWRMDRDGGNPIQLTKNGGTFPSVSPDSQSVFYSGTLREHSGVWKVPISGGSPKQVVYFLADRSAVSPDGKFLAYTLQKTVSDLGLIFVARISGGGPERVLANAPVGYGNLRWTTDGRGLVFIAKSGDLEILPLSGGPPRKLVEHGSETLFSYDISPDGKRLAYTKGTLTSSLVMISDLK